MMPEHMMQDMFCTKCGNTGWAELGKPKLVLFDFEGQKHNIHEYSNQCCIVCDCNCDKAHQLRLNPDLPQLRGASMGKLEVIKKENPRKVFAEIMEQKEKQFSMAGLINAFKVEDLDDEVVPF